jgi:hypothetical protein
VADGGSPAAPSWLAPFVRALRPWLRDIRRAAVTGDALLSLDDVCELIPGREVDVRAWVQRNVRVLAGPCGDLYRWRDVLRAMGAEDSPQAPPRRRPAPSTLAYEEP